MTFQLLVSTMDQADFQLLDRMNVQSDAVIINQCDKDSVEELDFINICVIW